MKNYTRDKFQEAKYFLEQMKRTFEDDDIFSYNLGAFLSAARSITFYMQKQYSRKDGFPEWYCGNQIKMTADPELKYLNKARVAALKTEPVRKGASRELTFTTDAFLVKEGTSYAENAREPKPEIPSSSQPKTVGRFFPEFNGVDVIEFCEKQLNKLKDLVQECESQFS